MRTILGKLTILLIGPLLVAALILASAAFAQENRAVNIPIPENPVDGFRLFDKKGCMECHAIGGYGGTAAQDMTKVVTEGSFYGVAQLIWNHVPKMSEKYEEESIQWPRITPEEMSALIPFLSYLNFFDRPGDPEEGEKVLFREKCVVCHRVGKVGIVKIKSLDEFKQYRSPVFFLTRFWNSGKAMGDAMRVEGLPLPEFHGDDLMDIIAYIKRSSLEGIKEQRISLSPGNPKNGQQLFSEKGCATCHRGGETSLEGPQGSFTRIAGRMVDHALWKGPNRPEMPNLTPEEMSDLVSYLYFLGYLGKPGTPMTGERLFFEKRCADCHAVNGKGGTSAPDLGRSSKLKSPIDLFTGMWNTAPKKMEKEMVEKGVAWPQFEGSELADLFAYFLSSQGK